MPNWGRSDRAKVVLILILVLFMTLLLLYDIVITKVTWSL